MLEDCLRSVRDCAGEIIVVDTGSTDATVSIAQRYGARVISFPWTNDFAEARNVALSQARYPWILSIDADERIMNPEELAWVVQTAPANIHGFLVNLSSHAVQNNNTSRFVSQLLRVFRNDARLRFSGCIHEQIINAFSEHHLSFAPSNIEVEHLGYNLSPSEMQKKQIRNLELLNSAIKRNANDAYMLQQRAKTYLALAKLDEAELDTQAALQTASPDGTIRPQALNYGAVIAFQRKDTQRAIERAEESLRLVPHQAFAYYILGEVYTSLNDYQKALQNYLAMNDALERNDVVARVIGAYNLPHEQRAFCLGRSYMALQQQDNAEACFREGLEYNSKDISCRIGLANCAMNKAQFDEARRFLQEALQISPDRSDLHGFLARVNEVEAQHKQASSSSFGFNTPKAAQPTPSAPPTKPFISLCMIVKNEEHRLATCLESVQGVVDQIVIVDTGSTDGTVALAKNFGAEVYYRAWDGDFAAARNEALKHCTGEWILYLDADESLTVQTIPLVRETLSQLNPQVGGVICTIISPHRQEDTSTEVHRGGYPRIFRNYGYPRVEFRGRVHEQITPSLLECGAYIVDSPICILHTGYDIDRDQMEVKVKRNYELLIRHVQEEPLNAYAWFQLGQTLGRMNMAAKSEEALKFAIQLGTLSLPVAATAASTLAHICGTQQRYEEALQWAEMSLSKVPTQLMALNYKAYSLLYLMRLDEAEQCFHQVLDLITNKGAVPEAGYDVELSPKTVHEGLNRIRELRMQQAQSHNSVPSLQSMFN